MCPDYFRNTLTPQSIIMKRILVCIIVILSILEVGAVAEHNLYMQSLGPYEGLADNYIRSINQDSKGFVWVVSSSGLNRFNGKHFVKFTKENSGLPSNGLNCVLQDPVNPDKVWIATREDGLCYYDYSTGKIEKFSATLHTPDVTAMDVAHDNRIWITHYNYPPERLDPISGKVSRLFEKAPAGLPGRIWCSAEDHDGRFLYLGHENSGLSKIDLLTLETVCFKNNPSDPASLVGESVYALYIHNDGNVWIGTEKGLTVYIPSSGRFIRQKAGDFLTNGVVKSIRAMKDGQIWATTDKGGIMIFSPYVDLSGIRMAGYITTDSSYLDYPSLNSSNPISLFEDSYGNMWVGYNGNGIDVIGNAPSLIKTYHPFVSSRGKTNRQSVWSLLTGANGNIWIGGEEEIIRWNSTTRSVAIYKLPLNSIVKTPVLSMCEDKAGYIWVGTQNEGAFRLNPSDGSFVAVKNIDREVSDIIQTSDKRIIAATHNGLFRIDADCSAYQLANLNKILPDFYITSIAEEAGKALWIGTFGQGVSVIDSSGKLIKRLYKANVLHSNIVNDIKKLSDGKIWIATRDGVAVYDYETPDSVKYIKLNDGVHSSNFKAILEDNSRKVWISAEDGLSCYDRLTDSLSVFTRDDKSTLSSFIASSSAVSPSGDLFFGSNNGLTIYSPSKGLMSNNSESGARVTQILANDKKSFNQNLEVSLPVNSDHITIPYNLNTFTISFSDPDITRNVSSEVKYNLQGVNNVWTLADGKYEAVYRNLKPGKYIFRICIRPFGGEWSEPVKLLTVTITPPVFLSWWAKLLYALLIAGAIFMVFYFYRYKMNLEKNLAIEKENSKNTLLLNEEKLMFYTNVTHELRTPLSLIIGPIEDLINAPGLRDDHRKKLHTIRTSSIRLLNLINGILEFRKTETRNRHLEVTHGNLANVVREIGLRFKELNGNRKVSINIDVAELQDQDMYFDSEIITTILNNLIGNALKYTKEGSITLSLHLECKDGMDYVALCVSDTGEGIAADELPHIFKRYYQAAHNKRVAGTGIGLALVKNMAEIHEATVSVESEKGKGSKFTIRFIADNTYPYAKHITTIPAANTDEKKDSNTASNDSPEKLNVLLVEDDDDLREYIRDAIGDSFNVDLAEDGEMGMARIKENMPDIVVSDIMMPKKNGIELCNEIKNNPFTNHIPVILLTAKDSILDREEGYKSGADSYITKPFSAQLLVSRINNLINSRHMLSLLYILDKTKTKVETDMSQETELADADVVKEENAAEPLPPQELSQADRQFIDKFRSLIESNIETVELDIPFLTDKMCMSHSTLYRKVKGITGLTPNEFTRKIKLSKAAEMILAGETDMSVVSYATGFNSPAYFKRVFKKEFGVFPTDYIQEKSVIQDTAID